jgi:mannose-6-phosphate isomerase-like protein (cupin superfamily)
MAEWIHPEAEKMMNICMKRLAPLLVAVVLLPAFLYSQGQQPGYVIEKDKDVAKPGPGPHNGQGQTTGYVFFDKVPGFKLSFRKRILHPGSSIGYHKQEKDEVYYYTSGTGRMNINGQEFDVKPGDCTLTRMGSSHSVLQTGKDDLVIIIAYEK